VEPHAVYNEIPELVEGLKPASGGVWASLFASSAAVLESSGAVSKKDDTIKVDSSTEN